MSCCTKSCSKSPSHPLVTSATTMTSLNQCCGRYPTCVVVGATSCSTTPDSSDDNSGRTSLITVCVATRSLPNLAGRNGVFEPNCFRGSMHHRHRRGLHNSTAIDAPLPISPVLPDEVSDVDISSMQTNWRNIFRSSPGRG